ERSRRGGPDARRQAPAAHGPRRPDALPARAHRLDDVQERAGRAHQPVRAVLLVLLRQPRHRLDRRPLRRLRAEQLPADGAEHPARRRAVDHGRLRLRPAAVPRACRRVLRGGRRAARAVLHLHDPAVLPAPEHGDARQPGRDQPGARQHAAVVRHLLHARLLLRAPGRARPGGPDGRRVGVADLPAHHAADDHVRAGVPHRLHVPAELEQLPRAAAVHAQRRVPPPHARPLPVRRRPHLRDRAAGGGGAHHGPAGGAAVRLPAAAGDRGLLGGRQGL
ncbi:MAG: ABC transporter, permease protein 2 (cluster 1, maltose/g3p/polyamine/iron), partial [uncultured Friedmanniella sp.]